MKTSLRIAAVLTAAMLLTSCSSGGSSEKLDADSSGSTAKPTEAAVVVESLPFNASGLLATNAQPNFADGEAGEISVVSIGSLDKPGVGASLLFAFRNNTDEAIAHVDWTSTARSGGSIVANGSSQGTTPSVVQPGEVGLAYIYFDNGESIPDGAEYEFTAGSSRADNSAYNTAALRITEANLVGDSFVGAAINDNGAETVGPYSVQVYCFEGDSVVSHFTTYAQQTDELADGSSATFSAALYGDACPTYAIGVSGYYS